MGAINSKRNATKMRILCALLCLSMLVGMFMTSCNNAADGTSAEGSSEEATEATTPKSVSVVRLKDDIKRGDKITSAKLETVELDSSKVWIGALTDSSLVIGKYALSDMSAGDFLFESSIAKDKPGAEKDVAVVDKKDWGLKEQGFVVVTEYINANTGEDVSAELQKIIDTNAKSVIYFPDGEYIINTPIYTASNGALAVSLKLSDNAVIKASDTWDKSQGAMIRLGGEPKRQLNSIMVIGSNYYIEGGIIDGNGVADGVAVDHGRETSVRDLTIINTNIGLHVKDGANGGSSDADIENIRIYGNGSSSSVGLLIEGWDNTFSNMRIANVCTGVRVKTAANLIRDVQVTYVPNQRLEISYAATCGFDDLGDRNWYDNCSSTGFATGFKISGSRSFLTSCVIQWTEAQKDKTMQVAISTGKLGCVVRSTAAYFTAVKSCCEYLVASAGGKGKLVEPIFDVNAVNSTTYEGYLSGKVTWYK